MNVELVDREPMDHEAATPRRSSLRTYAHQGTGLLPWVVVSILLLVASVADFALIRTLMMILLPYSSADSVFSVPNLVASAVVVLSTAAMFGAGLGLAHHEDAQSDGAVATRRRPVFVWIIVAAWTIVGITLITVRFVAVETEVSLGTVERERLLAILMSGLYIGTGLLAIADGYLVSGPYGKRVRQARRHRDRLEEQLEQLDGTIAELVGQVRRHEEVAVSPGTDPAAIQEDYANQRQAIQDLSLALQRFAQVEIARRVGSEEAAEAASAHDGRQVDATGPVRDADELWEDGASA